MQIIITAIVFIVLLSVIILIHEFGHFFSARKFGIKAEEFGWGFPPKIWGKKIGETLFTINLFPIGGFVRLKGEDSDDPSRNDPDSFASKAPGKRFVVAIAGILLNFVLAIVVFQIMLTFIGFKFPKPELPFSFNYHFVGQSTEVLFLENLEDENAKSADAFTIKSINGQLVNTEEEVSQIIENSEGENIHLALINEQSGKESVREGIIDSVVEISEVVEGSPAHIAGIAAGEEIIRINGEVVSNSGKLQELVRGSAGEPMEVVVENEAGEQRSVSITAEYSEELDNLAIGIAMYESYNLETADGRQEVAIFQFDFVDFDSPLQKIFAGVIFTENMIELQVRGIGHFIAQSFETRDIQPIRNAVAGPIGIASITATAVDQGALSVLYLAGLLSAIIGFMILLPIPALDGGRIFFILVEILTRKRVNPTFEKWVHMAGFAFLITLIILITYNDILRFFQTGSFSIIPN